MFELGNKKVGRHRRLAKRLESDVPLKLSVLDLGGAISSDALGARTLKPEDIQSVPFHALWRGFTHPGVSWKKKRVEIGAYSFASMADKSFANFRASRRKPGKRNYVLVAPEYICLKARLSYPAIGGIATVDALVGDTPDNNYVNFCLKDLTAPFLAEVLLRSNFGVQRRGNLVTAWLRRYPRDTSEEALTCLGKLMVCARQLNMLVNNEAIIHRFADRFLQGDYRAFA